MIGFMKKADDCLAAVENFFLMLFSGAMVLILMIQVVLRYGFSRPLFWAEEISVQLLVFITLIGLSILLKRRQMIAIDMIVNSLPTPLRKGISLMLQVLGLMVVLFFAYEGTLWILRPEVRMEISPTTGLPVWINYAIFPVTFYCMTFHMAVGLVTLFRKLSHPG
ncbi:MAG: TRAP transporter small permease [Desulfohalobiaceae bacterium]|nr:TRAP transporter small permease [Desulfohalobiaceae bacterium]